MRWVKKPKFIDMFYYGETEAEFVYEAFVAITGITIKPGECLKVEFSAKVVER